MNCRRQQNLTETNDFKNMFPFTIEYTYFDFEFDKTKINKVIKFFIMSQKKNSDAK